ARPFDGRRLGDAAIAVAVTTAVASTGDLLALPLVTGAGSSRAAGPARSARPTVGGVRVLVGRLVLDRFLLLRAVVELLDAVLDLLALLFLERLLGVVLLQREVALVEELRVGAVLLH